ncbi:hypothetical protein Fot_13612 [Forsythia ovata]|uniref:Uncharacterized protein n=1 Tax=Forsythia ovata TaxID=205694 RepID=A0ABD1W3Y6_9LAMI
MKAIADEYKMCATVSLWFGVRDRIILLTLKLSPLSIYSKNIDLMLPMLASKSDSTKLPTNLCYLLAHIKECGSYDLYPRQPPFEGRNKGRDFFKLHVRHQLLSFKRARLKFTLVKSPLLVTQA